VGKFTQGKRQSQEGGDGAVLGGLDEPEE